MQMKDCGPSFDLTEEDFTILNNEQMLNDNIINYYLEALGKSYGGIDIFIASTFFVEKLRKANDPANNKEGEYAQCERWFSKQDVSLTQLRYIVIPVHIDIHWTLIIYCLDGYASYFDDRLEDAGLREEEELVMQRLSADSERLGQIVSQDLQHLQPLEVANYVQELTQIIDRAQVAKRELLRFCGRLTFRDAPCVLILDSLGIETPSHNVVDIVNDFIQWGFERHSISWEYPIPIYRVEVPIQPNYWECGVYLLHFVRIFLEKRPQTVEQYESLLKDDPMDEKRLIIEAGRKTSSGL